MDGFYTPLFALVGVALGATMTAATSYLMARRSEREVATRARRLVAAELETMRSHLIVVLEEQRVPERLALSREPEAFMPTRAWRTWGDSLASGIPDDLWIHLPRIYVAAELVRNSLTARDPGEPLETRDVAVIQELLRAAFYAEGILLPAMRSEAAGLFESARLSSGNVETADRGLGDAVRADPYLDALARDLATSFARADKTALTDAIGRQDEADALAVLAMSRSDFEAAVQSLEERAESLARRFPELHDVQQHRRS